MCTCDCCDLFEDDDSPLVEVTIDGNVVFASTVKRLALLSQLYGGPVVEVGPVAIAPAPLSLRK